jgi:hypothetical protein
MAAETHVIALIALNDNPANVKHRLERGDSPVDEIMTVMQAIRGGTERGRILFAVDQANGTAATNTITWDGSDGDDGDTVTVCGVVLTARTSPSTQPADGEFALSTNDTTQAENFDACVNAHPRLRGVCTSDNVTNVSTITMANGGITGNLGTLATTNTDFATLGAASFSGGAAGTKTKDLTIDTMARNI